MLKNKKDKDNFVEKINNWNKKLPLNLQKEKYKKMADSPYIFFRGTNHLFWEHFANDLRLKNFGNDTTKTWVQGDLHAYNYGIFSNDKDELVYDFNDFDESCIADYQYDIWRMAASIVLIADENKFILKEDKENFINHFTQGYFEIIKAYKNDKNSLPPSITKHTAYGKLDESIEQVEKEGSRKEMLHKWAVKGDDNNDIFNLSNKKLEAITEDKRKEIIEAFPDYQKTLVSNEKFNEGYFKVLDVVKRITSGTGSYGYPRYYVLIRGKSNNFSEHRILDVKLQNKPTPYHFFCDENKDKYNALFLNEGRRHAIAYIAISMNTDNHLGWIDLSEGVFSVKERSPYKSYFQTKILDSNTRFIKLAEQWGKILASNHIRAHKKFGNSEILNLTDNMLHEFSQLVFSVALEYVSINENAYKKFMNKLFLNE